MTALDPDLLRACAGYIAHEMAYRLTQSEVLDLLRADAMRVATRLDQVDQVTERHLDAIRAFGKAQRLRLAPGVQPTARAILDASPSMLRWWCETLEDL